MLLRYFYDRHLAQASYLIACQQCGEALVIDPARDIRPYLAVAEQEGLRITQVTETHIHADFVSGARELAAATGAQLYLSAEGGPDWQYAYADSNTRLLHDGDHWNLGRIQIEALHTPGHTPEHLVFLVTDTAGADSPMGLFTGDCLFVGNAGRPDLLEKAAGKTGTKEAGAHQQFASLNRLKSLPDYLQIWPGHGAGSACGKGLGSVPSSTLGYEKRFNPALQFTDEAAFVDWLLADQPEAPRYFGQMKRVNKDGPALLRDLAQPARLTDPAALQQAAEEGLVIDTRPATAFAQGHAPRTVHIPLSSPQFNTYAGWYVRYDQPTWLIADADSQEEALTLLRAIGVDDIPGIFDPAVIDDLTQSLPQITPEEAVLLVSHGAFLLDVRGADEYRSERIAGAHHIPMGYVPVYACDLPKDRPLIVQCGGGVRSMVVASLLQRAGFDRVMNLSGGIDGWKRAHLPVETG
ncbi:MAG: MBL fold metallo-hydrolase [Anaerolineae bacterium]|nr:MBL fold metallo-hydrolase [Anaerolineae bacterium]